MGEIKCPNCGKTFAVDESGYAELIKQARDEEFERQLCAQAQRIEQAAQAREEVAFAKAQSKLDATIAEKNAVIARLEAKADLVKNEKELAVRNATAAQSEKQHEIERERDELKARLAALEQNHETEKLFIVEQERQKLKDYKAHSQQSYNELKLQLDAQKNEAKLNQEIALQKASNIAEQERYAIEQERDKLKAQIERDKLEKERIEVQHQNEMAARVALMQEQIDTREREIDNIKHMRAELSVKMIGESLEQYCESEFNKLRATAFQNSYFQKDNDDREGSKGDYIYREYDEDGAEVVSIMFEMKNEAAESVNKKRNEDHFKKLDKDRTVKRCEYAVLVSLLERDNEFYNTGIVDVSYSSGFEKMYVIRPQFFIPIITLIRNAAMKSVGYKRELAQIRQQNVDVTHFEDQLDDFKAKFGRNCNLASRKFKDAIKDIDDTIKKLQKIRDELTSSDKNINFANDKLEKITIKRLTRANPTMKAKFEEARSLQESGVVPPYHSDEDWNLLEAEIVEIEESDEN